jgi:hypothetical protein
LSNAEAENIQKSSGLMIVDLDHLTDDWVRSTSRKLRSCPFIFRGMEITAQWGEGTFQSWLQQWCWIQGRVSCYCRISANRI